MVLIVRSAMVAGFAAVTALAQYAALAAVVALTPPVCQAQTTHVPESCGPVPAADFRKTQQQARQGDRAAQSSLAIHYDLGLCTPVDHKAAFKWYKLAAEQNDPGAQTSLGDLYSRGEGTEQNDQLAYEYYRRAADQGYVQAMNNIAFALLYGKGVEPSVEKAIEWYEKAALSGSVDAMDALGMLYEDEGHGVVDYKTSFEWYKRAADKGDYLASVAIADAYVLAKGVPKDPGKAFQLYSAIATRKQGASDGYIEFRLASAYCEGKGTARNYAECLRLARASATHDEWRGQLLLGSLYQGIYTGSGAVLTKSLVQADKWYTLACHHDDSADVKEISSEARGIESAMTDQELSQSVELSRQWTPEGSHEKTPIDDCISQRQSQAILRIRCREIYRRTSQKAISALTVLDVQQMQSCEALGLYPPQ